MTSPPSADLRDWMRGLADELCREGELTDQVWRDVFWRVPRHVFIPERFWFPGKRFTVFDRDTDPLNWWRNVYDDCFIVTQVDDGRPAEPGVEGEYATSSASQPSIVFRMLRELDLDVGHRVLEIGTATGYNVALLCARLGDAGVTTVEISPELAQRARRNLVDAGWRPTVHIGDGAEGYSLAAPYDRVLATCAVREVPLAWVDQSQPGGLILTPWGVPYLRRNVLVRLTKQGDATASGPVVGDAAFMWLRDQRVPVGTLGDFIHHEGEAAATRTALDPRSVYGEPDVEFGIGIRVAECQYLDCAAPDDSGEITLWFFDAAGSWASVDYEPDVDSYLVEQYGVRRLWDEVESAYRWWVESGRPRRGRFGLTVTRDRQYVWLDTPDNEAASQ